MELPNELSNIKLLEAIYATLDFLYLAKYPIYSSESLHLLKDNLNCFHASKDIFVELGIRTDFNLPRLHFLIYYIEKNQMARHT